MNYQKIYDSIIQKRRNIPLNKHIEYCEEHHIIPKCVGGTDDEQNLIKLSAREHYIVHLLLVNIFKYKYGETSKEYLKMLKAITFFKTCNTNKYLNNRKIINFNSRIYQQVRIKVSQIMSEQLKGKYMPWLYTKEVRDKIKAKLKNRKISEESKRKISKTLTGRHMPNEIRQKISKSLTGYKRPIRTTEHRLHLGQSLKGKCVGNKNGCYGRKWMYHPISQDKVYSKADEIQKYLDLGYVFGVNDATRDKNRGKFIIVNGKKKFIPKNK